MTARRSLSSSIAKSTADPRLLAHTRPVRQAGTVAQDVEYRANLNDRGAVWARVGPSFWNREPIFAEFALETAHRGGSLDCGGARTFIPLSIAGRALSSSNQRFTLGKSARSTFCQS